jgi:uncharacterized protein (DUF2252 family)
MPLWRLFPLALGSSLLFATACNQQEAGSDALHQSESKRADWVRAEIGAANSHLDDAIRGRKFEKMSASAFTFYRGSNHLFWADFAADERLETFGADKGTATWVQGDLHVFNYGAYHDDDGRVVYDLNDFDESFVADYQFDVWRAATSLVLVARSLAFSEADTENFVDAFSESYLDALDDFRDSDAEEDFVVDADNAYGKLDDFLVDVAEDESRAKMLGKWTVTDEQGARTLDTEHPKLAASSEELTQQIHDRWSDYGASLSGGLDFDPDYFAIKAVADRLDAGIGSLGTPRYYVLIEGPTASSDDDIIVDLKRASAATGAAYVEPRGEPLDSEAERAVTAQKALGVNVDDHLGWLMLADGSYSVRERSPFKATFEAEEELTSATRFTKLAEQWGLILAADHARADSDFDADYVPHSFEDEVHQRTDGEHDEFRALVWSVAWSYGAQVERDYETFLLLVAESEQ